MFLHRPRVSRALSAFDHASHRWAAIPLRNPHDPITQRPSSSPHAAGKQTLSLTSWNIQASQLKPVARSELILDHILKGPKFPDILLLQEVASSVRKSLLSDPRVRSSFLITDAEDDTSFKGVPFATMTLLSNKRFGSPLLAKEEKGEGDSKIVLDSVFRTELPSRYNRDALCVNIATPAAPGQVLRLFNVHLDSLDSQLRRIFQMVVLAGALREPGCSGGIIAGDFNAIYPDDHVLVDEHELVDAWVALHGNTTGSDGGATWGVGAELEGGLKPGRLDKVVMLGLQPTEIEVLQPGLIDAHTPWSDHCGLRCTFTI
ncbi:Endonuclease/exonuclease/phosphatase [Cantharellus anzutake]|uniref:Endonuclease/exonuclease/phosphatase n=1 Tax=Cantharellus anzutake TaxID=1750568 RepID=UPI0019069A94|nr:Endonuclease/exonuclease/phosphatase [Cantharellus anzutake]KAF8338893.1 Endonuclease/exonuclease/phosphatase [Cantharellus anzutake]